ncbi:MAG: DUF1028 domain-containing protein [Candidatus Thermoplasmatota archaeon]|nr:DUF1028 domain-containing protein [Candidatus Thermoplasmatota archaeon]
MTYSVVARDPDEDLIGVAVASRFIAVGAVVPWVRYGVGAIATQSFANYTFGPEGLDLLSNHSAQETLKILLDKDPQRETRQVGVIDREGRVASYTGKECFDYAGSIEGKNFTVQGNILTGREVLESMAKEMESDLPFMDRLIHALKAGESAGGDSRGKQSAAILVAGKKLEFEESSGIIMDIRVDDHPDPVHELERISKVWKAIYWDNARLKLEDRRGDIKAAISRLGYRSLMKWARAHGLEHNITKLEIGSLTLDALLYESELVIPIKKPGIRKS